MPDTQTENTEIVTPAGGDVTTPAADTTEAPAEADAPAETPAADTPTDAAVEKMEDEGAPAPAAA